MRRQCHELEDGPRNLELLEDGRDIPDDLDRRRHKIADVTVERGVSLANRSTDRVITHLVGAAARYVGGLPKRSRALVGAASHRACKLRSGANEALGAWSERTATDRSSSRAFGVRTLRQATSSEKRGRIRQPSVKGEDGEQTGSPSDPRLKIH